MTTVRKERRHPGRRGILSPRILIVIGVAVLAAALLIILNIGRSPQLAGARLPYETGVTSDGDPYKGSPDAPLHLLVYSDFVCGHCGALADALEALSPEYVETGKIQVVFRSYAFLTPESVRSAEASECALDQGADGFWKYHDVLFANRGTGLSAYSDTRLREYARQVGIDISMFNTCLDSEETAGNIQTDLDRGIADGVQGTPTWFINGEMVPGALPEDTLRALFDEMLAEGS